MRIHKRHQRIAALTALASLSGAHASSVNIQVHRPGSSWKYTVTENALGEYLSPEQTKPLRYTLYANYNYVGNPLVETDKPRDERLQTLVSALQTLDLMAQIDIKGDFALNLSMPMHVITPNGGSATYAPGDLRVSGKIYFVKDPSAINFALVPEIYFPTGDARRFLSDDSIGGGAMLAIEKDFSSIAIAANAGFRASQNAVLRDMDYRQRIPLNIGAFIPVAPQWALTAEARRDITLPANRYQNPSEFYGGGRYEISPDAVANLGIGLGSWGGATSVDYRVLAGLKIRFAAKEAEPVLAQAESSVHKDTIVAPAAAPEDLPPVAVFTAQEIEINQEVKFLEASDVLLPQAKRLLDEVARVIHENDLAYKKITIEGHTNYVGSDKYNMSLSKRRSASVRRYLVSQGLDGDRLGVAWYGERRPKPETRNLPDTQKRIINRRVEFKVQR